LAANPWEKPAKWNEDNKRNKKRGIFEVDWSFLLSSRCPRFWGRSR
jgi:hypothetical protein